jgi:hypothetical protein
LARRNTRRRLVFKKVRQERASVQRGAEVGNRRERRPAANGAGGLSARCSSLAPSILSSHPFLISPCLFAFPLSIILVRYLLRTYAYEIQGEGRGYYVRRVRSCACGRRRELERLFRLACPVFYVQRCFCPSQHFLVLLPPLLARFFYALMPQCRVLAHIVAQHSLLLKDAGTLHFHYF